MASSPQRAGSRSQNETFHSHCISVRFVRKNATFAEFFSPIWGILSYALYGGGRIYDIMVGITAPEASERSQ